MGLLQQFVANWKKWLSGLGGPPAPQPVPPAPQPFPQPVPGPAPGPAPQSGTADALLAAHNAMRARSGLPPLAASVLLGRAAQRHAAWMAQNRDMDHTEHGGPGFDAPDFMSRVEREGYFASAAGENIAAGQATVEQVMAAWAGSRGHLANILGREYVEAGFGLALDSSGLTYWCVDFGARARSWAGERPRCLPNLPDGLAHPASTFE